MILSPQEILIGMILFFPAKAGKDSSLIKGTEGEVVEIRPKEIDIKLTKAIGGKSFCSNIDIPLYYHKAILVLLTVILLRLCVIRKQK